MWQQHEGCLLRGGGVALSAVDATWGVPGGREVGCRGIRWRWGGVCCCSRQFVAAVAASDVAAACITYCLLKRRPACSADKQVGVDGGGAHVRQFP